MNKKSEKDTLNKLLDKYNQYSKEPRDMQDQGYHDTAKLPKDNDACPYIEQQATIFVSLLEGVVAAGCH